MAEPIEDGIFREIDEELRQENFAKLWKKYGNLIIAGAIVLVVAVGGYQGWRNYDLNARTDQGERFAAAVQMAQNGSIDAALEDLNTLYGDADSGYRLLSAFQNAGLQSRKSDGADAVAAYDRIANDGGVDDIYQDLARLLAATVMINLEIGDQELLARLQPLNNDANPWRHGARELLAVVAERSGDKEKSRNIFKSLTEDATAPQGIRQRAAEMLAALGGK